MNCSFCFHLRTFRYLIRQKGLQNETCWSFVRWTKSDPKCRWMQLNSKYIFFLSCYLVGVEACNGKYQSSDAFVFAEFFWKTHILELEYSKSHWRTMPFILSTSGYAQRGKLIKLTHWNFTAQMFCAAAKYLF